MLRDDPPDRMGQGSANAAFGLASAVPSDLHADELYEINELRTNAHRFTATGGPLFRRFATGVLEDIQD